jgi:translocation and assembly module TamA
MKIAWRTGARLRYMAKNTVGRRNYMNLATAYHGVFSNQSAKWRLAVSVSCLGMACAVSAQAQEQLPPQEVPPVDVKPVDSRDIAEPSRPPGDAILPPVETIIDDVEFRAALPKIGVEDDPELDKPLESIAEFERRQAAEMAERRAAGNANGGTASAAVAGNAEQGEDAASRDSVQNVDRGGELSERAEQALDIVDVEQTAVADPELTAPLEPLATFDVTPVVFAEAEDSRAGSDVRYEIAVNGMDAADEGSDVSLRGLFKELSALHDGKGKSDNIAMLRARLKADGELAQRIMTSEGYYDAAVNTRIDRVAADQPLTAIIDIVPGVRYRFSSIKVEADPTQPADLISKNFPLQIGEPIVAERVQGAEAALALKLPEFGYPFAEIGQRDILLDGTTGDGEYTLPVTIGPRARFGGVETTGDLAFDAAHVDLLTRFDRGDLYNSVLVDDLRQALVATGLFSNVATEAKRTGEFAEDGAQYVTLMVTQDAGPPRTIAGSIGYGTGEGFRLQGSWSHRNLFPPEGALIVSGLAGTQEQRLGVTMRRSNAGKRDRTFELVGEALRSTFDAFDALTGRIGFRVSRDSTPIWQKKFSYAYGAQLIATREDDYNFATDRRDKAFYTILGLTGQVGMDRTDNLLDATKGFRLTALVRPEGSMSGKFTPYAVTQLDGSAYYPVMDNLVLAGRVRIGSILGAERERLAPSRRFYAGGGGSVRGFGYQELGPKDPNLDPIGGRSVNEAAVEARYRFGNFGVVGFVDAGQVYRSSMPDFSDLRFGAGIGGRFYTNFGPMRLDIATPMGRKPGESRVSVYVSIGQAF